MGVGYVVWCDGEFVEEKDANLSVASHVVQYGVGIFEGVRTYATADGDVALFRVDDHLRRFEQGRRACAFRFRHDSEAIKRACAEVVRVGGLRDAYLRILGCVDSGPMSLRAPAESVGRIWVIGWERRPAHRDGLRVKVSSFRRNVPNSSLLHVKSTGSYVNSYLATREALRDGYDDAVFLDNQGYVAEATTSNLFAVMRGELVTPPASIALEGVTRASVIELAADLGLVVREALFGREELGIADEVFLTGTAGGISGVSEIDGVAIGHGEPGETTLRLRTAYIRAATALDTTHASWLMSTTRAKR